MWLWLNGSEGIDLSTIINCFEFIFQFIKRSLGFIILSFFIGLDTIQTENQNQNSDVVKVEICIRKEKLNTGTANFIEISSEAPPFHLF